MPQRGGCGLVFQGGGIVGKRWVPGGDGGVSDGGTGGEGEVADVVVYGEGRDGGAIVPLQVILGPALAVALEGEESVVGDDCSVEGTDAAGDYLRGQVIQGLERRVGAFGVTVVGVSPSGERRVARRR